MYIGSNAINSYNFSSQELQKKNKVAEETILRKKQNEAEIQESNSSIDLLAPNAPQSVKDAWKKAEQETGMNGYGMDATGKLTHISTMFTLQAEQRLSTGHYDFLGNSKESAMDAAKRALERLNNPLQPEGDPNIQALKEKEKLFYDSFINNLKNIG